MISFRLNSSIRQYEVMGLFLEKVDRFRFSRNPNHCEGQGK